MRTTLNIETCCLPTRDWIPGQARNDAFMVFSGGINSI
jgi:hypothetical protein